MGVNFGLEVSGRSFLETYVANDHDASRTAPKKSLSCRCSRSRFKDRRRELKGVVHKLARIRKERMKERMMIMLYIRIEA